MLESILFDYSDAYIIVKGNITVAGSGATKAAIIANKKTRKQETENKQYSKMGAFQKV